MRLALLVLVCWLVCLPLARADAAKVLAADHLVHVDTDTVVRSRWVLDRTVRAGEVLDLRLPLSADASLESMDVLAERDLRGRIMQLAARHELYGELVFTTRVRSNTSMLPVASPRSHVVERIRNDGPARIQLQRAGVELHFGIRTSEHVTRSERRRADQLLDGRDGHRRFTALYFYGEEGPLSLSRAHEARRAWGRLGALVVFALGLVLGVRALARARRRWQREQRTAYLRQALSAEDRELLGLGEDEES